MGDGDVVREQPADRAVHVPDRERHLDPLAALERGRCGLDQLPVEGVGEWRVLRAHAPHGGALRSVGLREEGAQVDPALLPLLDRVVGLEQVDAADEILVAAHPEPRHDLARLLGDVEEEVDDVLRLAGEALAQLGILGGDPDGARVEVAGAHHHAARRDQRRGGEADLVGTEEGSNDDVASRLDLAVRLHPDARAEVVAHERLLRLGEADLPRDAGEQDRRERRGAGAAVVAGDQHVVGVRLRDSGGDGADAHLGDELHRDPRLRVRAAQVVDQLLQVLDRVDVVMRRRRDEADARRRQAHARDVAVDLVPGQLAALAGLRALRHLDLELVGVREVVDRDAEAAGGDLLDRRAPQVAVRRRA